MPSSPLDGRRRGRFANLPQRVYLTYKYRGISSVLFRSLIFPLRLTPLDRLLQLGPGPGAEAIAARRWYSRHGRPVTIVIPSYRDAKLVAQLVTKIRQTTDRDRVRIIVADDASGPEHLAALGQIDGIEVVAGEQNAGFATNANRGLRAADPQHDVILLNSDVVPIRGWLASLQYATTHGPRTGIVGAKLLYPDNRIQYAGTIRNPDAPDWFDHRYRFEPADWGPADIAGPTLAATGACMYIRRAVLDQVGLFDEEYGMGYEDIDYCLRAWEAGYEVIYAPSARLHHHESIVRGTSVGERERKSQRVFWRRWGTFFGERPVRSEDGRLRVVYVVQTTNVFGGLRVVFEHLNGLVERGHDAELWTLGTEPDWFELRCPVRSFPNYDALVAALAPLEAIKVATWWETATPVWRASVVNGLPVYLVQDIETSYYPEVATRRHEVLNSYRPEYRVLTTSTWNQGQLAELGLESTLISPGVDLGTFRPLPDVARRHGMLLALGRSQALKNLPLTLAAWRRLPEPRPELCLFGSEPELAREPGMRYVNKPSDREVNELLGQATAFLQTSTHEGFCLTVLEAMAAGCPVICTDADGNRDFCVNEANCLMPDASPTAVAADVRRLLADPALCSRLAQAGLATATAHTWDRRIDELERFMLEIARPHATRSSHTSVRSPASAVPRPGSRNA
ncbi:MAG TPA: glycosyltransferase [Solirubrobacteraceae bacterium]|nr:glycosyltransferase [Solirubrobacteraceae bacterium]